MRPRRLRGLLALALGAGCSHGATPAGPPRGPEQRAASAPRRTFTLDDGAIEDVVRAVSAARQLAPRRPVAVERLDRARFVERLLGGRDAEPSPGDALSSEAAFLLGFDFLPQPGERGGLSTVDEVLEEQVVGFYSRATDKVFIPDVPLASEDELLEQRAVLAHEVQHALQAQRFSRPPEATSADEAIAQLALIEGDAMVAMGAWLGAEAGAPVGRTLRRIVEVTKRVPLASVTRGEASTKLDRALDLTRKRLEFPYRDGMLLVTDVYRAGGFPLVDKMYTRFPRSTEQVLHPEKYLAGEPPRPFADPRPPPGYALSTADTLGELSTRVLLERCVDPDVAERAAAGWAGDRFGVFVGPDRRLATAWISAWDTEKDAEEIEATLGRSAACWRENALGLERGDYTIGANIAVRRRGKLVAFVRGVPERAEAALASHLFTLAGPEPVPTPLADLPIPPRVRLPEPEPGRLDGDVYRNEWLDLVGRVPPGMLGRLGGDVDFVIERPDTLVRGGMSVSTRITSDVENEKTFGEVQESFAREVAALSMRVEALGGGPVATALGAGIERTWRVSGTWVELRLVLIPICAGTGSIVFIQAYGDPYARGVLDGWMASFRWTHGRNLTACDFLDPK
ncbi:MULTISPECIES: hypothetical protein [Sorangium]|uniref:DUF4157 domain-containing protein n=1 Tax=Sorangium cellulosum TaxID=56 RepID=A0A4P2QKM1_SORCE|nr:MULTISPECIES: hypothetical protein [Sorangium]AUX30579.1 uncharacterized protein SOCE836_026880 [Sorangium cellulosum]WCQ89974.1 hypothetical protein NQZ70_02673 [Sorangium sp. Soce836]